MKKIKILCLGISLFLISSLSACGGSKSVELTTENYQDYLDVRITTSRQGRATMINVSIKSRNNDYIFDNCRIVIDPVLISKDRRQFLPKDNIKIDIKRDGSASYSEKWADWYNGYRIKATDGKVYESTEVSSYVINSITGKVSKNPLS